MIPKIQKQIFDLERRGYRRSDMVLYVTEISKRHFAHSSTFKGVQIQLINGILPTCYVMVPFVEGGIYVEPGGKQMVRLIDADTRVLDEGVLIMKGHQIVFEPETVYRTGQGRMDTTGPLLSYRKITV